MLGGLTNSGFWSRPDTSDHVSYSDDGCLTWTTFASQKADAGDSWGWGNSSWFIRQRRPPHFQLAQGTTVAACGYVVARRTGATDGWLISLGGPPEDTVNDLPTDIEGGGLTDAINRIDRDFWGLSPIPGEPGWLIGNQNLASATSQVGSLMKTPSSDLSAFFWDDDLPDEAVVETVDDTDFEGNKYEGAASGSFPVRHGRIVIAAGRMWSVTGWAGFEIGDDQLVSSAGGGIWRRDQDFRLQLPAENEYGGHGAFKQHPFFDRSVYSATGAIHDIAQNRQRPDLLMCVGRIANAARYSSISNRFLCYSMSEDGGSTWSPPMQFPPTMNQPYYVWSV